MRIPRRKPIYPFGDNDALYFGTSYDVGMYWDGTYLVFDPVAAGHENLLFSFAASVSTIYGGANAGDNLFLRANAIQGQSAIEIRGGGTIVLKSASDIVFNEAGTEMGRFAYAANVSTITGGAVAGDDLTLKANTTDDYPFIVLPGNGDIQLQTLNHIYLYSGGVVFIDFEEDGTDDKITGQTANNDLFLNPNGTGVVKFGTRTATGDVVSNGHVTTKDAAGNTVKLMTTA